MIYRTAAMLSSREGSAVSRGLLKKTEFTPPMWLWSSLSIYFRKCDAGAASINSVRRLCVPLMGCRCA